MNEKVTSAQMMAQPSRSLVELEATPNTFVTCTSETLLQYGPTALVISRGYYDKDGFHDDFWGVAPIIENNKGKLELIMSFGVKPDHQSFGRVVHAAEVRDLTARYQL